MNKKLIFLFVFLTFLGLVFFVQQKKTPAPLPEVSETAPIASFQTQTASINDVTIEVTPKQLGKEGDTIFTVSFDTHSKDLNFDLTEITLLLDDIGTSYRASSWTGGLGGHHLSGELVFPRVFPEASKAALQITLEGEERNLEWEISK